MRAALLAWLLAGAAQAVEPGQPAPDIALPQATLAAKQLSELRGQLVYLDFWASWCGPCRQSFPWMGELQKKYGGRGLQVLAINLDKQRADADAFLARTPAAFALAFDAQGEAAKRFAIKGMPSSVLIAPDGQVLWAHRGFRVEEAAELEARIVQALPR
ncbi:MAG: TlpA disulfide reductase family protein [Inhella sp.]